MSFSIWTSSWIGYRKSTEKWQLKAGRANKSNARRTRPRKTKEMGSIKRRIAAVRMIEMDGWAPFFQMVDAGGPLTNWHEQHMPMMAALPTVTPAFNSTEITKSFFHIKLIPTNQKKFPDRKSFEKSEITWRSKHDSHFRAINHLPQISGSGGILKWIDSSKSQSLNRNNGGDVTETWAPFPC